MASSSLQTDFVDLPFTVDETTLADSAIEVLRAGWAGWEPDDADIEVLAVEAVAAMAAAVALIASTMPAAALRAFGVKLLGIPYEQGTPAGTTVTIDVQDTAGYTVPAGGQFNIDGFAFATYADAVVPPGSTSVGGVQVFASGTPTASANGLTGALVAQLTLPAFVIQIRVENPTSGGSDPQTDVDYQNMVSREQRLRAKTIVTTSDFELEGLNFSQEIGRIQAVGDTARLVTVTVATIDGLPVSTSTKTALAAHYDQFALVNTTFTIGDPSYTPINVVWQVKALPGVDAVALKAQINAVLTFELSPGRFGQPSSGQGAGGWLVENTVRHNVVIAWIAGVLNVEYVESVTINGSAGDVVMTGSVPLPTVGTLSGIVDP